MTKGLAFISQDVLVATITPEMIPKGQVFLSIKKWLWLLAKHPFPISHIWLVSYFSSLKIHLGHSIF